MIPRFDFVIVMQGDTLVSEPTVLETPDGPYVRISDLSPAVLTLMQHLDRVGLPSEMYSAIATLSELIA